MSTQPPTSSASDANEPSLERRFLLRGGAVLAGAAGATVIGAALAPSAHAADGDTAKLGQDNTSTSATTISIGSAAGNPAAPALKLANPDGPALAMTPVIGDVDWRGTLAVGEMAATTQGPLVGVDYGDGAESTTIVTGIDLDQLPLPIPIAPVRVLDTRRSSGLSNVVGSSTAKPFDSQGRLKTGQWIDIGVGNTSFPISGAFVNVTAVTPPAGGHLILYASGKAKPAVSNLNFTAGVSIANSGLVAVGLLDGDTYAVRVYTAKTTHVLLDLSGFVTGVNDPNPAAKIRTGDRMATHQRRLAKMRKAVAARG